MHYADFDKRYVVIHLSYIGCCLLLLFILSNVSNVMFSCLYLNK